MKDVAAAAGVSLATVSRVVNGVPVAPDLADRVHAAARELDYRKDVAATSLRRADRRTSTIGLVLEDVANPFSSALHRAIEDASVQRGLLVLAGSSDEDPERERELLRVLHTRRVDGLIVVPSGSADDELHAVRRSGTPVVCVDRASPVDGVDTVVADNRGGIAHAVRSLYALGHRRFGFLADHLAIWTASERLAGFEEAMTELRCRARRSWVHVDVHGSEPAHRAVRKMFTAANAPTAVVTAQNALTIGARRALVGLGLQHTVAHVGFDDFPQADMLDPPMTVIAQDPAEMGRQAARILLSRLDGPPDDGPPSYVTLPTRHIPRGSGELPPP
jgi:LacI family transcriptional regulator